MKPKSKNGVSVAISKPEEFRDAIEMLKYKVTSLESEVRILESERKAISDRMGESFGYEDDRRLVDKYFALIDPLRFDLETVCEMCVILGLNCINCLMLAETITSSDGSFSHLIIPVRAEIERLVIEIELLSTKPGRGKGPIRQAAEELLNNNPSAKTSELQDFVTKRTQERISAANARRIKSEFRKRDVSNRKQP